MGTFLEAQDWARKEYDLAESRARSVRELVRMADVEQNLQQRLEEEPEAAPHLAERFDGDGTFSCGYRSARSSGLSKRIFRSRCR